MDRKLVRINYIVGNTLYMKCFRIKVHLYDELNEPIDFFTTLLADQKNVSKDDVIIKLFVVSDLNDKIEFSF